MDNLGKLYIVATPIGNLEDISLRALETLKQADIVACEDTRQTQKLLSHFEINKPTVSYFQHSKISKVEYLLDLIKEGKDIALVTDAGTPGISDPGNKLVAQMVENHIEVVPIPGASAVITALSVSAFATDKFLFLGFMPHKGKTKMMTQIVESEITVCFYESVHRIEKTLIQLKEVIQPDRQIMIARELTKKFESIYRGTIDEVIEQVGETVKGEYVVVVERKR